MSSFTRTGPDAFLAEFSRPEGLILASLAEQLVGMLSHDTVPEHTVSDQADPALHWLFPDAYPDDPEAAAEFRRFTIEGLAERKLQGAQALMDAVIANPATTGPGGARAITLSTQDTERWLRTLTDLRLTIATRLSITADDEVGRTDEAAEPMQEIYFWLGALQESLVNALDA